MLLSQLPIEEVKEITKAYYAGEGFSTPVEVEVMGVHFDGKAKEWTALIFRPDDSVVRAFLRNLHCSDVLTDTLYGALSNKKTE